MIKEYDGIPRFFRGMGWSSQLNSIGINVQCIFNPFNHQWGLNYKTKDKSKSIVWDGKTPEETNDIIVRNFEKKHFAIPKDLSPYGE